MPNEQHERDPRLIEELRAMMNKLVDSLSEEQTERLKMLAELVDLHERATKAEREVAELKRRRAGG